MLAKNIIDIFCLRCFSLASARLCVPRFWCFRNSPFGALMCPVCGAVRAFRRLPYRVFVPLLLVVARPLWGAVRRLSRLTLAVPRFPCSLRQSRVPALNSLARSPRVCSAAGCGANLGENILQPSRQNLRLCHPPLHSHIWYMLAHILCHGGRYTAFPIVTISPFDCAQSG